MKLTRRILHYFRPYLFQLIASFLILATVAILWQAVIFSAKPVFDGLMKLGREGQAVTAVQTHPAAETVRKPAAAPHSKDKLAFITRSKNKLKKWLEKKGWIPRLDLNRAIRGGEDIMVILIMMLTVFLLKGLFTFSGFYILGRVGFKVVRDIRDDLYRKMTMQSVSFFDRYHSGTLISRITNDVFLIQNAATTKIGDLVKESLILMILIAGVFYISPGLSTLLLVIIPLNIIPFILISRAIRRATGSAQSRMGELTNILKETITGNRIVKAFSMEEFEIQKFVQKNYEFFKANVRMVLATAASSPIMEFIGAIVFCVVIFYGSIQIRNGVMTVGTFVVYIGGVIFIYSPIRRLVKANNDIQQAVEAFRRIFELMDEENRIQSPPHPAPFPEKVEEVAFNNVCFHYEKDERPVLSDVSFSVKRGTISAFVGSSGAGKTTLANLVPRFFDVTGGSITINGIDIREFELKDLRRHIGMVTQETILFDDTVFNNIAYGRADFPMEQVVKAAKMAFAHEFIEAMPNGYQSGIRESGVLLSGGQRQRLSIARALLKNPPILILDEATSALDTESEILVQKALNNLMQNRTTFVIAHRLSTIRSADVIYVMDRGKIVESGCHDELIEKNGIYTRLYNMQFGVHNGIQ
ncbi:MAG: ATP-binding cassette domain-containing protein [Acidobacteria bacterium]|nr:ATP-binding cassette domain-containing protein [Acidobacteriota bacterium]